MKLLLCLIYIFYLSLSFCYSQVDPSMTEYAGSITIELPFGDLRKYPFGYSEESGRSVNGTMAISDFKEGQKFPIKVHTRGRQRLRKCNIPPLEFHLKLPETIELANYLDLGKEIKAVLPCDNFKKHKKVLREYFVYQLYFLNQMYAFKTKLYKLTIVNTSQKKGKSGFKTYKTTIFLIEHIKHLIKRTGLERQLKPEEMDKMDKKEVMAIKQEDKDSPYQRLGMCIGDLDRSWGSPARDDFNFYNFHNLKAGLDKNGKVIFIPYDFDLSVAVRKKRNFFEDFYSCRNFKYLKELAGKYHAMIK